MRKGIARACETAESPLIRKQRDCRHPSLVNFDSLADGLYGLPPGQFVAERTAAEKQARSSGDREMAKRIHQLAKPTTVGWLANQLVRSHPEEIGPLLELGADLREATAHLSREKLQELMRLQHQVIAGLIKQARSIARDAGQRLSEDAVRGLEDTLRAALADEALGEQLLKGQLTGALEHDGFPGAAAGATAPKPAERVAKKPRRDSKESVPDPRIAQAEQAVSDAQAAVTATHEAGQTAQQQLKDVSATKDELARRLQQLQADLETASHEYEQAERAEREAQEAADRRGEQADQAQRRLETALAERDKLVS
jgi:hypothetical protein